MCTNEPTPDAYCCWVCRSLVQLNANEKDLQQFEIEVSKPGAGSVKLVANGHMMVAVLVQTGAQVKDTDPPALTTGAQSSVLIGRDCQQTH